WHSFLPWDDVDTVESAAGRAGVFMRAAPEPWQVAATRANHLLASGLRTILYPRPDESRCFITCRPALAHNHQQTSWILALAAPLPRQQNDHGSHMSSG